EIEPVVLVEVDDALGVRLRREPVAALLQTFAQLVAVVDLAVEDDPDVARFVRDGLVAGLEIDDAEAPRGEADGRCGVEPFGIGAAMLEARRHRPQQRRIVEAGEPGYSAHGRSSTGNDSRGHGSETLRRPEASGGFIDVLCAGRPSMISDTWHASGT